MHMVASGAHEHALVVGADVMSSIIDYKDRTTCVLFGDGAGAVVLSAAEPGEPSIIGYEHQIDGAGGPALCMPAGGSRMPASHETVEQRMHYVKQDGQAVFKFAVGRAERSAAGCSIVTEWTLTSSTCSSRTRPTGASSRRPPSGSVSRRRRSSSTSRRYGNTTAATIPLALADAVRDGRLKQGDLVLLASVGAGFTAGAMLLRWSL